ncbi:MAG TPA: YggT family protein, partial [Alphaproteobacteria bacterium]|nr:YggT family protein [Alphaproteobacteria bacterium]
MTPDPILGYLPFHALNYLLAAVMWTLLGRFVLGLFVPVDWNNYIWQAFRRLTDPVLRLADAISFRKLHPFVLPLFAVFLVILVRIVAWDVMYDFGMVPTNVVPAAPAS